MIYKKEMITLKLKDEQTNEQISRQQEAMVAFTDTGEKIGLAYITHVDDDQDVHYSVTHIASGLDAGLGYRTASPEKVEDWIERLTTLAVWTDFPVITDAKSALKYALIGAWWEAS